MSKTKTSIVHWTPEEESRIRKALPAIKKQSGKYIVSTKSEAYATLRESMPERTAASLNIKIRTMLADSMTDQVRTKSVSDRQDIADQIMESFYAKVPYQEFRRIESHINTIAQQQ